MNLSRETFVLLMGLVGLAGAISISEDVFKMHGSGRSVLQQENQEMNCEVNFEVQNYTIITSKCTPPEYGAGPCCSAFKEFACPFTDQLNDVENNDCASIMFDFIDFYGKYPPSLFFNKCKEGKEGLACPMS